MSPCGGLMSNVSHSSHMENITGTGSQDFIAMPHFELVTYASFLSLKVWSHSCLLLRSACHVLLCLNSLISSSPTRTLPPNKLFLALSQQQKSNWHKLAMSFGGRTWRTLELQPRRETGNSKQSLKGHHSSELRQWCWELSRLQRPHPRVFKSEMFDVTGLKAILVMVWERIWLPPSFVQRTCQRLN